jgi:hypothetical protein
VITREDYLQGMSLKDQVAALKSDLLHTEREREEAQAETERWKRDSIGELNEVLNKAVQERDEAVAHRDDYETMSIEMGMKIRELQLQLKRFEEAEECSK